MTTDNSGGAFSQFGKIDAWEGLTKREYYAAHALQQLHFEVTEHGNIVTNAEHVASYCFAIADAMVEASKK